ncbi:hypothetical protein V5O48_005083 [Marasmius crinis-equi]|uniref:Fork-head domain-containing protein n=1 Tax=Marasmius crinis-equi TaxID=585013 RepID=A0ABR3FNA7_9AGAR
MYGHSRPIGIEQQSAPYNPSPGQHQFPSPRRSAGPGYYTPQERGAVLPPPQNTNTLGMAGYAGQHHHHPYYDRQSSVPHPTASIDQRPPVLGVDIGHAEVEAKLRRLYDIPPNRPIDLNVIPDPPSGSFTHIGIAQIAIWSSEHHRLTQAEIYERIERRFRFLRDDPQATKRMRANIRHLLSLKKTFAKLPEKRGGAHFWSLDYRYLESGGDKRERKRGPRKVAKRGADQRSGDDGEDDTDGLDESQYANDESSSSSSPSSSHTGAMPSYSGDWGHGMRGHTSYPYEGSSRPLDPYHSSYRTQTYPPPQFLG